MTRVPYRMLALDLDGTLLNAEKRISSRVQRVVRQVMDLGVTVLLATGRGPRTSMAYQRCLGLVSPLVVHNGALVLDPALNRPVMHQPLPAPVARAVAAACGAAGMQNLWVGSLARIYCQTVDAVAEWFLEGEAPTATGDMHRLLEVEPATKMLTWGRREQAAALGQHLAARFDQRIAIVHYEARDEDLGFVEVMKGGVSKLTGVAAVTRRLGLTLADVVAVGDEQNDVELLSAAGLGIAMGNARAEVRRQADLVAPPVEEDGLATVLTSVFLSGGRA